MYVTYFDILWTYMLNKCWFFWNYSLPVGHPIFLWNQLSFFSPTWSFPYHMWTIFTVVGLHFRKLAKQKVIADNLIQILIFVIFIESLSFDWNYSSSSLSLLSSFFLGGRGEGRRTETIVFKFRSADPSLFIVNIFHQCLYFLKNYSQNIYVV